VIVVDASVVIDVLLNLEPHAETIRDRFRAAAAELVTLHLVDAEVGQALRRYVRRGDIPAARAETALEDLAALPLHRYPHVPLVHRAFALRNNVTFYDALYIALAEGVNARLLTRDAGLARVPGHAASVDVVG
jgi:predicted nucleic acid-binding protein